MAMTQDAVLLELADYYHDCIDGDDPCTYVSPVESVDGVPGMQVMFESGRTFWITVEDIT